MGALKLVERNNKYTNKNPKGLGTQFKLGLMQFEAKWREIRNNKREKLTKRAKRIFSHHV